eukprot:TRINITY_DN16472_c0_g2_i1.p1 TRINITY_DN16472_c0_g2~~TRINITY_DN16472_c0_g2_i1.p1  ORF type:complete len:250 (-),score=51.09 TRINITY_DN16472_c0_g2_i1:113-862(-)
MFACCAEDARQETFVVSPVDTMAEVTPEKPPEETKKEAPVVPAPVVEKEAPVAPAPVVEEQAVTFRTFEVIGDADKDGYPSLSVLIVTKDHLVVHEVKPGALSTYNSKQESAQMKVRRGDRIIAINGESASADKLKTKLEEISGAFTLRVEKPKILGVTVKKASQKLGLSLEARTDLGAIILDIQDGCIATYNTTASAAQRVKVNDIITGTYSKDDSGKTVIQNMPKFEDVMTYISKDGVLSLAVLSYS